MLPNPQPQSRWIASIEHWDARLTRFRDRFDPFSHAPGRPLKTWAVVALSAGLVVLAVLIAFGTMWIISHHKWALAIILLKMAKWLAIGVGIVLAIVFRDKLAGKAETEPAKK
jgi:hypothetical protein